MKLTKTVIDKLPVPANGYVLYRDDELPGFGVRVTHAGVKSFFLEKRIHRKVKRLTLGRYGVLTAEQAREGSREVGWEDCERWRSDRGQSPNEA
jgi:hypothetical protein